MKSLLVLSFYLTAIAFVSGIILNETSLLLRPKAINIQNQSQKVFLLNPQARGELKIGNLIYLKNLMELRCLKKTMEDIRNKNQLGYQQSHIPLEVSLTQNFENQISKVKNTRLNPSHVEVQNKVNPGNSRIIFVPYKGKFVEGHVNKFLKNKKFQSIGSEVMSNDKSDNFSEKKSKFIPPPPFIMEKRKNDEYFATENSRVLIKNKGNSPFADAVFSGSYIKNHDQPKKTNNVKSTPTTHPVTSQQQILRILPYEVKEFFREDLFDQKSSNDFKNHQFDKQNLNNFGSPFLRRKQGRKAEKLNLPGTNIDIKNSKSKTLGTLEKSVNSSTFSIKKIFNNSPSHNSHRGSDSSNLGMYSDNDFSDSEKKTVENKFTVNSQEQKKQLKTTLPYSSEIIKNSTERSTKSEIETNFTPTIKVENVEKVFATKVTNAPSSVLKINYLLENQTKNLEPTTTMPEIRTFTFPEFFEEEKLDVPNALFKNQEPSTPTSFPLIPTENEIKKFITEETVTVNESSSNFLFTSSKSQTTAVGMVISKFPIKDSSKKTTKYSEITENAKKIEMEEGLTKMIFTEFTDRPLTTDLLTTNKKNHETVGKNSRKMHFNQEFLTTTAPDQISQGKTLEQRRSDILIDDLDDYFLQESVFSSNYMKQLKQNNNLNSSSDFIIQLIPFVINDLRENKISSEDLPILSKAFGDYWPTVLTLTNSTNLDMLPLLKMKNEKDLSKILGTFFPEKSQNSYSIATELNEADRDKFLAYYYEDDYTDLSEEQREYWKNKETFKRHLDFQEKT